MFHYNHKVAISEVSLECFQECFGLNHHRRIRISFAPRVPSPHVTSLNQWHTILSVYKITNFELLSYCMAKLNFKLTAFNSSSQLWLHILVLKPNRFNVIFVYLYYYVRYLYWRLSRTIVSSSKKCVLL